MVKVAKSLKSQNFAKQIMFSSKKVSFLVWAGIVSNAKYLWDPFRLF